jgi:NCS1 family nucleobase:cation symporter-1
VLMLAAAGRIGAIEGVPSMVLLRPVLGLRGSFVPSVLNVVQLIGWTAFELWIMGAAAAVICSRWLGHGSPVIWIVVFGVFSTLLALGGPVAVVRQWLGKFGVWAMLAASIYLTYRLLGQVDLSRMAHAAATPGVSFWVLVDLVIAMPVSWLPLVADYNRFARTPGESFRGTFVGYLVANVWFYLLGFMFVMSAATGHAAEGTDLVVAVLTLTGGAVALILVLLDETDNVFADIYSASVSVQNVFPALGQRGLIIVIGAVGTLLAATVQMADYYSFLLVVGSVFVPLFALLLADYYVVRRGAHYDTAALYRAFGPYWFARGVNWVALVAWLVGVVAYHALARASDVAVSAPALAWLKGVAALGSSLPAFVLTFALYPALVWSVAAIRARAARP